MGSGSKRAFRMKAAFVIGVLALAGRVDQAAAIDVLMAEAPTTSLELTAGSLQKAKKEILLNIYELTSPEIVDVLVERLQKKIVVRILQEGQPVGGLTPEARKLQDRIVKAMRRAKNGSQLLEMTSKASTRGKRRFRYDHAKYAVIDNTWLVLGSENYSPGGMAVAGSVGNRGWQVRVTDVSTVALYRRTFEADMDQSFGDLIDRTDSDRSAALSDEWEGEVSDSRVTYHPERLPLASADDVDVVLSPVNSFCRIIESINLATQSIDVEQMGLNPGWETPEELSPVLEALVQAARRGVKIRVLLNDEAVFGGDEAIVTKNEVTVKMLQDIARSEGLPVQATIANLAAMGVKYIHNKGLLVDGQHTLVSSINWNRNSILNNREAAVLIRGESIFAHYRALFDQDWKRSTSNGIEARKSLQLSLQPIGSFF